MSQSRRFGLFRAFRRCFGFAERFVAERKTGAVPERVSGADWCRAKVVYPDGSAHRCELPAGHVGLHVWAVAPFGRLDHGPGFDSVGVDEIRRAGL